MSESTVMNKENDSLDAWKDPREIIQIGVMMRNGRLAPRSFSTRAQAEQWAQDGEEVVEWNLVCECDR